MDEKQKQQVQIMHDALTDDQCEKLWGVSKQLEEIGRDVLKGLSAFDILRGNSEKMLVANAVMQIRKQVDLLLTCEDE